MNKTDELTVEEIEAVLEHVADMSASAYKAVPVSTIRELCDMARRATKAEALPEKLEELVERLKEIAGHDWRISFLAHTSDTAKEAADTIEAEHAARVKAEGERDRWREDYEHVKAADSEHFHAWREERLARIAAEASRDALERALEPFAKRADAYEQVDTEFDGEDWSNRLVQDFRRARTARDAALSPEPKQFRAQDHHIDCEWHHDQYDNECTCGLTRPTPDAPPIDPVVEVVPKGVPARAAYFQTLRPPIDPVTVERCAQEAEHLNGWGADNGRGGHAMHIAKCIRALAETETPALGEHNG